MIDARTPRRVGRPPHIAAMLACTTLVGFLAASAPVDAATATNTFTAQAVILASCNVSATTLDFGNYDPTSGTALAGTSTVNVFCSSGTSFTTTFDVGTGGGSYVARTIANGGNTLDYNLYRDAAHAEVWGDGTGSTFTVTGTGAGLLTTAPHTVYGLITAAQDQPPGTYSSTITVTVTY
jgi:spore coat protein U domain-containing protein, fimbrial subunit CupE1/2/3/6